jgi:tRNA dimethylallyltransferase
MTDPALLALVGPTASGKTEASVEVAGRIGAEIVSIDPALAYRGMDVWTAKPTPEQRRRVPHHLIDLADPEGPIGVAEFQRLAAESISGIRGRGRRSLVVGASGLYFRAVVDGLEFPGTEPWTRALLDAEARVLGPETLHRRLASFDPAAAARIQPANARRTVRALEVAAITGRPFSDFYGAWDHYPPDAVRAAGIDLSRADLRRRIDERVRLRFPELLEEARTLLDRGFGDFVASFHLIGYAEAAACLRGDLSEDEAAWRIAQRDRALARRQRSWFRRDPRVRWFPVGAGGAVEAVDELARYFVEDRREGVGPSTAGAARARGG